MVEFADKLQHEINGGIVCRKHEIHKEFALTHDSWSHHNPSKNLSHYRGLFEDLYDPSQNTTKAKDEDNLQE